MYSKQCPECGLWNTESAIRCDCGYDFISKKVNERYSSQRKKRNEFTLIAIAVAIVAVCCRLELYAWRVIPWDLHLTRIHCRDSSGYIMCSPEVYERMEEDWRNEIIREEGNCYSQLASLLNTKYSHIEDIIIGYCIDKPPRCPSFQPSTSCDPPPIW